MQGHADPNKETVVFIHGLQRSGFSMVRLEKHFHKAGYNTIVCSYKSSERVPTITTNLFAALNPMIVAAPKVHFVTHSMGGIILREHCKTSVPTNFGRAVLLAPPNKGSELIDKFADFPGFDTVWGKAGHDLGTGPDSLAATLPDINFPCGVIAGDSSITFLSLFIPGKDDGRVSIEKTHVGGISQHLVLHTNHTFMTFYNIIAEEALHFIQHGTFFAPKKQNRKCSTPPNTGGRHF